VDLVDAGARGAEEEAVGWRDRFVWEVEEEVEVAEDKDFEAEPEVGAEEEEELEGLIDGVDVLDDGLPNWEVLEPEPESVRGANELRLADTAGEMEVRDDGREDFITTAGVSGR
jgi:hypothetical protein